MLEVVERIREKFPEAAASADKVLASLPASEAFKDFDTYFPEVRQKNLTDLEVFDFLSRFVDENEYDPKFQLVREQLAKEDSIRKHKAIFILIFF
jgi:hypothetical protein